MKLYSRVKQVQAKGQLPGFRHRGTAEKTGFETTNLELPLTKSVQEQVVKSPLFIQRVETNKHQIIEVASDIFTVRLHCTNPEVIQFISILLAAGVLWRWQPTAEGAVGSCLHRVEHLYAGGELSAPSGRVEKS